MNTITQSRHAPHQMNEEQWFAFGIPHPTIKDYAPGYNLANVKVVGNGRAEFKIDVNSENQAIALISFLRSPAYLNA